MGVPCLVRLRRIRAAGDLYAPWTVRYVIELEEQKFMESLASANGR